MIWTSYFANIPKLPKDFTVVSIAGKPIPGWTGLEYKKLAPKIGFWTTWKEAGGTDNIYYKEHYYSEVLDLLNPETVLQDLYELTSGARDIVLVCYESPEKFCHRHLVSEWLRKHKIQAEEYIVP